MTCDPPSRVPKTCGFVLEKLQHQRSRRVSTKSPRGTLSSGKPRGARVRAHSIFKSRTAQSHTLILRQHSNRTPPNRCRGTPSATVFSCTFTKAPGARDESRSLVRGRGCQFRDSRASCRISAHRSVRCASKTAAGKLPHQRESSVRETPRSIHPSSTLERWLARDRSATLSSVCPFSFILSFVSCSFFSTNARARGPNLTWLQSPRTTAPYQIET